MSKTLSREDFLCRYLLQPLLIKDHKAEAPNRASVLIPLIETEHSYSVLFTRRSKTLRHHPGQISFPGGRKDKSDSSLLQTAIRECQEETGLTPAKILGRLPLYVTNSGFAITPYVGLIHSLDELALSQSEVDEVFCIPLSHLLTTENYTGLPIQQGTRVLDIYWIHLPELQDHIWGATAGILHNLLSHLNGNQPRTERY